MASDIERSLKNSIIDGVFAQMMSVLTSGLFLTGYVIALGGNSSHIGVASSLPLISNVFQIVASYLIELTGRRKDICIIACYIARSAWLFFAVIPLVFIYGMFDGITLIWFSIFLYFLIQVASSIAGISWLSWMKDLVPSDRRGKYFGLRSAINSTAGLFIGLIFGKTLDYMKTQSASGHLYGFVTLFLTAFLFGMISNFYLKKIDEPAFGEKSGNMTFMEFFALLKLPFKNAQFRRLMFVNVLWTFFCQFGSPFFNLYMLRDLKISFTMMAVYDVVNLTANISMYSVWGRLSDHFGNKSVLLITTFFGAVLPAIMVFANTANAWLLVPLFEFTTGLVWSGISLTTSNIFLKVAPREHSSIYLSLNSAMNGLISSLGPVMAGFLAYAMADNRFEISFNFIAFPQNSGYKLSFILGNLQVIFVLSVVMRLFGALLFRYIEEPESRPFENFIKMLGHGNGFASTMIWEPVYSYVSRGIEGVGKIETRVIERVKNLRGNIFKKKNIPSDAEGKGENKSD